MKKISVLLVILLLTSVAFVGCGGSNTAAENEGENSEVYTIKIAELVTTENPSHIGLEYLGEQLREKSDGRFDLKIFPNGEISSSDREQVEMAQNNVMQMAVPPSFILSSMHPELKTFNIFDVPYLFTNEEDLYGFVESDMGKKMKEDVLEYTGLRMYGTYGGGKVKISTNSKPIKSPADLENLDIRVMKADTYVETVKAWGANPTPMAYSEVYTALQQGTVDGMMTRTMLYVSDGFTEVQKYMGTVDPSYLVFSPLVNNEWYESLPEDLQAIFDECMDDYVRHVGQLEAEAEKEALDIIRDRGVVVTEYTPEELQVFIDAAKPIWDGLADAVGGKEFLDGCIEYVNK
ncbi:MAG: TRAP transporter substrate-binding protein [Clostridia bacterium]|nr:TRAP transporter substrate-binding protein [Clostridia bacterium]